MLEPSPTDWSFNEIAKVDAKRSESLEDAPAFEMIVAQLHDAISHAIASNHFRCGTDFYREHQRAIFQFQVSRDLYDYFFNSRSGYRAQYWISPEQGQAANAQCLQEISRVILTAMPGSFEARQIQVENDWTGRKDIDVGACKMLRSWLMESLGHPAAKIWICERLMSGNVGPLQSIPISEAPRLSVPRWPTALAPYPIAALAWLDLKGGFVGSEQPKHPAARALQINKHGFS